MNSRNPFNQTRESFKRWFVHGVRIALFVSIIAMIRFANRDVQLFDNSLESNSRALEIVQSILPDAVRIGTFDSGYNRNRIHDPGNEVIGYVSQTSPGSDSIIGYSGPTNCLIVVDDESRILGISILNSSDTVEHVSAVINDGAFLGRFKNIDLDSTQLSKHLDGVSGATLTSYAIIASIANQLSADRSGESPPSLKFESQPNLELLQSLLPEARILQATSLRSFWQVLDEANACCGWVLLTSPIADNLNGYQGPTSTMIAFNSQKRVIGVVVNQSFDNLPYSRYLDDDAHFQSLFRGRSLEQLAQMDIEDEGVEGVSGATMTSMSVAEAIPKAANAALDSEESRNLPSRSWLSFWPDVVTVVFCLTGIAFSFCKKPSKKLRLIFLLSSITFLGFINGHMISQAMIVGWSQNWVPFSVAPGLVFLTVAALLVPMCTKHQPYCHHVCPFGALQQLSKNRIPLRIRIGKRVRALLQLIPVALLGLVVVVAMAGTDFNLAMIEPFDGFAFRIAGWTTLAVFAVGMIGSSFYPMAYCKFGCPTGALLNYLRFRADSQRLGIRDLAAASLLVLAGCCSFATNG